FLDSCLRRNDGRSGQVVTKKFFLTFIFNGYKHLVLDAYVRRHDSSVLTGSSLLFWSSAKTIMDPESSSGYGFS
ncbi:MAG: hypothetical protein AB8G77_28125, partial [Rhodothermales bacterium]